MNGIVLSSKLYIWGSCHCLERFSDSWGALCCSFKPTRATEELKNMNLKQRLFNSFLIPADGLVRKSASEHDSRAGAGCGELV